MSGHRVRGSFKGLMRDKFGKDYFLLAHVDVERASFRQEKEGVEFVNEIDAWSKMEFKFTKRRRKNQGDVKDEVESLIYGFRAPLDK